MCVPVMYVCTSDACVTSETCVLAVYVCTSDVWIVQRKYFIKNYFKLFHAVPQCQHALKIKLICNYFFFRWKLVHDYFQMLLYLNSKSVKSNFPFSFRGILKSDSIILLYMCFNHVRLFQESFIYKWCASSTNNLIL